MDCRNQLPIGLAALPSKHGRFRDIVACLEPGKANAVERKRSTWLTKRTAHQLLSTTLPHTTLARRTQVLAVHVLRVPRAHPALAALAAGSSSAARRSASSARRRSMRSPTALYVCCRASWPSAGRSFL